jgi:hypothetical protein
MNICNEDMSQLVRIKHTTEGKSHILVALVPLKIPRRVTSAAKQKKYSGEELLSFII